jgi:YjbE family integral membrane protein
MDILANTDFWLAVLQIIMIDILLGGDNAIVIALACKDLPENQKRLGIFWGTIGAIVLRIILIAFALTLLTIPYLKIIGGLLLLWIGIQLLSDQDEDDPNVTSSDKLFAAIKTVILADLIMSIDNVVAVAGAAEAAGDEHKLLLVSFGLLVSIPFIVYGSTILVKLMNKFPIIITIGGLVLGWISGNMFISDPALISLMNEYTFLDVDFSLINNLNYFASFIGAILVLIASKMLNKFHSSKISND